MTTSLVPGADEDQSEVPLGLYVCGRDAADATIFAL